MGSRSVYEQRSERSSAESTGRGRSAREVAAVSSPGRTVFAMVLIVGVIGPGLANYFLAQAGYGTLGTAVWAFGYATMVFVLWYVWVRPLDLAGPTGEGESKSGGTGEDPDR